MSNREQALVEALKNLIDDFDQTGCSPDLGVVSTSNINRARELVGMSPLACSEGGDYRYASMDDCIIAGEHSTDCDDDGYCNLCGELP